MTAPTPTPTPTSTPAPTATATSTPAPTATATSTPAPTATATSAPTTTSTPTPTVAPAPASLNGVVVGALLGLAAAVVVQVVIVPWVQRRSRRREQWETAVSELSALLTYEMNRVLFEYEVAAAVEREARSHVGNDDYDQAAVSKIIDQVTRERRAKQDALEDAMRRFTVLCSRVRSRTKAYSAQWRTMKLRENAVEIAILTLRALPDTTTSEESDSARDIAITKLRVLSSFIESVAASMRFPQPMRDMIRARAGRRWRALRVPLSWPYRSALKRMLAQDVRRETKAKQEKAKAAPVAVPIQPNKPATSHDRLTSPADTGRTGEDGTHGDEERQGL